MTVTPNEGEALPDPLRVSDTGAFRCDVLYVGDHAVVVCRGDIDLASAPELQRHLSATFALPIAGVTVDLAYVTFLDSSGVATLVAMHGRAAERRIAFRLEAVP